MQKNYTWHEKKRHLNITNVNTIMKSYVVMPIKFQIGEGIVWQQIV